MRRWKRQIVFQRAGGATLFGVTTTVYLLTSITLSLVHHEAALLSRENIDSSGWKGTDLWCS